MSFDTFKKIVDQSLSAGAIGIRLYHMGEPLLHKSIHKFVEYFNRQKQNHDFRSPCMPRSIGIQTNGVMLNDDLALKLMKAGLNELAFSIDGRTPQEYEKIRRGTKFDRVLRNLNIVKEIKEAHRFSTHISVSVLDRWKSPASGAVYPSRWRFKLNSLDIDLDITSNLADQEMRTTKTSGTTYWEGSVSVKGHANREPVSGKGYVELTGYAKVFDIFM